MHGTFTTLSISPKLAEPTTSGLLGFVSQALIVRKIGKSLISVLSEFTQISFVGWTTGPPDQIVDEGLSTERFGLSLGQSLARDLCGDLLLGQKVVDPSVAGFHLR